MQLNEKTTLTTGRRKNAVARVFIQIGDGKFMVNRKPLESYFSRQVLQLMATEPLRILNCDKKYDVKANVDGGGLSGQAGAIRHGIARALAELDAAYKTTLRKQGFLTRDPRMKERKKYGQKGARKRFQWTKR